MEKTSVTVIRHGETEWNLAGRVQGQHNSDLTENGIQQAGLTADALKDEKFDVLYSSFLPRAVETAAIINKFHNLEHRKDNSVAERNFGIMEGLTLAEVQEKFPDVYSCYKQRDENYEIPDGESLISLYARVKDGMNRIVRENRGKRLLVVTHGGVLDCMVRMVFDYPLSGLRKFSLYNASINRFSVVNEVWFLEEWGNINHHRTRILSLDA
jgi:broad specificity phosphatase PhoE